MIGRSRQQLALLVLLLGLGCSKSGGVKAPEVDPQAATEKALEEYDKNRDGFLDGKELERCPGLKSVLTKLDKDKDGRLSKDELGKGLEPFQQTAVGSMSVVCRITLQDRPLVGASVLLEPEAFLGPNIKPARATTDAQGVAVMKLEGGSAPGCHVGIYRVRITSPDEAGKESLPARYNTDTHLGIFVGPSDSGTYTFSLTTR
jgi:hypothetical protein